MRACSIALGGLHVHGAAQIRRGKTLGKKRERRAEIFALPLPVPGVSFLRHFSCLP